MNHTETNYFENTAEIESYEAMGIEYFVFVATLDDRTSEICQSMDGKKFKVKDAVAVDNYPPLHPNCRSTIRAYIGEGYEPKTRIYRDPKTGKNRYAYNMNYETWAKTFIKNTLNDKPAFRYTGNIIGGREHLRKVINKYENDGGLIPKRIARVLEGEQDEALLATLSEDTAKLFNTVEELGNKVKTGMQVVIDVDYVKHLDNSGHLTGKPYRKNHAKDAKPLTAADFKAIPSIIRNPDLITYAGVGRYGLKIKLEKVTAQRQRVILELVEKDGRLILTSFYNISKRNKKRA